MQFRIKENFSFSHSTYKCVHINCLLQFREKNHSQDHKERTSRIFKFQLLFLIKLHSLISQRNTFKFKVWIIMSEFVDCSAF